MLEKMIELKNENPNHEVHFLVDNDLFDIDYSWTHGIIKDVQIGVWLKLESGTILTTIDQIEEWFDENDTKYSEYYDDIKPELEEMKSNAKPAILVTIN